MAHARRKIDDLHVRKATVTTTEALRRIGELYGIEEQIRGVPPDQRRRIRQDQARPLLDDFEQSLRTRLLTLSTQSDTTKAINYMLNQWLIVTAKLNGIDPQAYLRYVLTHIADYPITRVAELLPWNAARHLPKLAA